ncbi:hypothetical protein BWZ20_00755 [Winogradskyella sp. J14-2]|uniref:hypothetical protein n=1 Tax=Winogradskyella sp. J14-2 TaxID=1936080 RepID=UPI000972D825|nr:hypothetical protein [Winogradskyella sp. J14-2]APY06915.1 hypothetical protein BWZ20_00755 [Winogradskyella sp. J14-2]
MKRFMYSILVMFSFAAQAQAPFTTLAMEPTYVKATRTGSDDSEKRYERVDIVKLIKAEKDKGTLSSFSMTDFKEQIMDDADIEPTEDTNEVGFFKSSSLALNVLNNADSRASINAQVLFYKINFMTPVDSIASNWRYNLPVMIISKLSTSYDSISGASAIDVLDYEAAPVTLRIMPSFKISGNKKYKEELLFGIYADARGINVQNTETNDYDLEVVGSGGIGFTLTGHGEAGIYNKQGDYEKGEWLVSAMLQGAVGDADVIQKLFNTDKDFVTSFQSYFSFNIAEGSKFNLKIGYQHYFQETIAGTKNNFSIALGL